MGRLIDFLIKNTVFINLITIIVIIVGIKTLFTTQREVFPNINFDIIIVATIYRGASPLEVEKLITVPIERELKGVDGIEELTSSSLEGRSGIVLKIDTDVKDSRKVIDDIKDAVARSHSKLPDDVDEPVITEVTSSKTPIIELAVHFREFGQPLDKLVNQFDNLAESFMSGGAFTKEFEAFLNKQIQVLKETEPILIQKEDSEKAYIQTHLKLLEEATALALRPKTKHLTELGLRELSNDLSDQLEDISDISSIDKRGYRDREIHVELDPAKLKQYNIAADDIMRSIEQRNLNLPGGTITENGRDIKIRTVKEFQNLQEIYNVYIRSNDLGEALQVRDVAYVRDTFKKAVLLEKAQGEEAIILTALKKYSGDAITMVDLLNGKVKNFLASAPRHLNIFSMNDFSSYVSRRLNVLKNNIAFGLLFVVVALFFFLGWRVALMVVLGIPFTFALTFIFMGYMDVSVNLISMFALIVISGMVVDDAIVVGENIYSRIEAGEPPLKATMNGTKEIMLPVLASVTTTMLAFSPLLFMSGIMGKFVWVMPAVIILALLASLLESFFILPSHLYDITKNTPQDKLVKKENKLNVRLFDFVFRFYESILQLCLLNKYKTLILILLIFVGSLFLLKPLGFILFPKQGIEQFRVIVESEQGVSLEEMNERVKPLESVVGGLGTEYLDSFQTRIGIIQNDSNDPFTKRGANYAQLNVFLTPPVNRDKDSLELIHYIHNKIDEKAPNLYSNLSDNKKEYSILLHDNYLFTYSLTSSGQSRLKDKLQLYDDYILGGGIYEEKYFVYYTYDHKLMQINLLTKEKQILYHFQENALIDLISKFYLLPNSNLGILITEQGNITLIDLKDGSKEDISTFFVSRVIDVILLPQKSTFIVGRESGKIDFYKYTQNEILDLTTVSSDANGVDFSHLENITLSTDSKYIYMTGLQGEIYILDIETKKIVDSWILPTQAPILWMLDAKLYGSNMYWMNQNNVLSLYDYNTKSVIVARSIYNKINDYKVLSNNSLLLFGSYGGHYRVDIPNNKKQRRDFTITTLQKPKQDFLKLEVIQISGGPPVGFPVSVEITGDDFDTLVKLSNITKEKLSRTPYVTDIKTNWEVGAQEFHLTVDEKKISMAGISVFQIATTLQMAFDGRVITSIKKADEEIDIRVLFSPDLQKNLDSLRDVDIRNAIGNLVSITELATFERASSVSVLTHVDAKRAVYVNANLDELQTSSLTVNNHILKEMAPVMQNYPGYYIKAGGEYEETQKSMQDFMLAFIFVFIGIFTVLVLLYGNLIDPLVIMSIIPMGITGVIITFYLHKVTFLPYLTMSFLGLMGVIGLTGVVINDSVILIDKINKIRRTGDYNLGRSIVEGCKRRLRAILLTTVTTVFGVLPTAYGLGGSDPLLKPMALSIGWGLLFATLITILVIPVLYSIFHRVNHHEYLE